VPEPKTLKLLVVEDDLEDEQLLCEALLEIEGNRQWCNWGASSIVPVDRLADTLDCLRRDSFDAILLNLSLPDSPALLDTFFDTKAGLDVSACAGSAPILVLADEPDENLANRLLREGAQDVLLKSELECAPLARAIRHAIERQRRVCASRTSAFVDDLTGVLTRDAFLNVASHYTPLSLRGQVQLLLASVEISADRDIREPLLIRATEALRTAFGPPSVICRWERCQFCVITAGLTKTTVEAMLHRAAAKLSAAVRFSLVPFDSSNRLEEILSGNLLLHAKTAILTD
jgi:DNA-binding NarL/FixJ family response regulator